MLTSGIIYFTYWVLNTIVSWFPAGEPFPTAVHTAFSSIGSYVSIFDPLIPFDTLLTCVLFVLGVEIAILGFRAFNWFFSHVPLIGGGKH